MLHLQVLLADGGHGQSHELDLQVRLLARQRGVLLRVGERLPVDGNDGVTLSEAGGCEDGPLLVID